MNSLSLELPMARAPWAEWREHGSAASLAVGLHVALAVLLLNLSQNTPLTAAVPATLETRLISLPRPAEPAPVLEPAPAAPPEVVAPPPAPEVRTAPPEQADLAFKRAEREREQARERERQQRLEQQRVQERQQREAEARERQLQQERQAQQAAERAEAARQAAAAQARAEAEAAAVRQYLPIAKEAPDYPSRALDRGIEGDCTVSYTVNPQGRVENPQVVGDCHPLFERPSLNAAKRFRYQPRIVDGHAVAVPGVKNTFTYRIR